MREGRETKDLLYEQVARMTKAIGSPKRLELLELLCQSEKRVELLAEQAQISVKLASAHLKQLKLARLVDARRDGKYVHYRLADEAVADIWVRLRMLAEERLLELQMGLRSLAKTPDALEPVDRRAVFGKAKRGEVVVLDVRPEAEYAAGHLPFARSIPLSELRRRLNELPRSKPIVAYCRGPFCLLAGQAVEVLQRRGFRALRLEDGVAEWRFHGLPVELS
ncbi:MAG TPA: metalloregulator ArsR/SmtB family transcription factor [Burkholderiales bacterium]|nr:metalloregulator ArsR/SmtB family transcription factor [Burkholderiales bacterium]